VQQSYGPGADGFGPVGVLVLVLLALLVVAAIWVARRPHLLSETWARIRGSAVLAWADRRFGDYADGLAKRSSLTVVAGLALLAGFVVVAGLAAAFTEILEDVLVGDGINGIDEPAAHWLAGHRELWLTTALKGITLLGNSPTVAIVAVLVTAFVVWRSGTWLPAVLGLIGAGGIGLVIVTAKTVVGRRRPASPFALITEDGFSFPSGHATGTAAVALLCAWMLSRWAIASWPGRVAAWSIAIGVTGAVGFSRIYLGVHYVSDVLAGWLLGAAWAGTVMLVGSWWEATRSTSASAAGTTAGLTGAAPERDCPPAVPE
jgi:membrane-associated phospholipid phosphatase